MGRTVLLEKIGRTLLGLSKRRVNRAPLHFVQETMGAFHKYVWRLPFTALRRQSRKMGTSLFDAFQLKFEGDIPGLHPQ